MDAWQRYLELANGLTGVTRKGAESVVRTLVKQGEVAADRAERVVDDLLQRSETNRKVVAVLVRTEVERAVARLGVAQQAEVDRLRDEVAALRARLDTGGPDEPAARPAKKSAAARRVGAVRGTSTARRAAGAAAAGGDDPAAATKPAGTAAAKKAAAKKATAKKATAKKSTATRSGGTTGTRSAAAQRRATSTAAAADSEETPTPTSPEDRS